MARLPWPLCPSAMKHLPPGGKCTLGWSRYDSYEWNRGLYAVRSKHHQKNTLLLISVNIHCFMHEQSGAQHHIPGCDVLQGLTYYAMIVWLSSLTGVAIALWPTLEHVNNVAVGFIILGFLPQTYDIKYQASISVHSTQCMKIFSRCISFLSKVCSS